jgi:uncharacterized DUF497 family protein
MDFEWNAQKADINFKKHNVSFDEAASVFGDFLSFTYLMRGIQFGKNAILLLAFPAKIKY